MGDPAVDVDDKRVIRVFILDDHELVRRGLTDLLGSTDNMDNVEVVGQAANAGEGAATAEGKTSLVTRTRPFVLPSWTGRPWPDGCPNGEG
jgi:hypothetical protein